MREADALWSALEAEVKRINRKDRLKPDFGEIMFRIGMCLFVTGITVWMFTGLLLWLGIIRI